MYFTNCVLVIYYLIIIVRFASHEEVNTFSVFFLENETDDPSVSQMLKLSEFEFGVDSPEGSLWHVSTHSTQSHHITACVRAWHVWSALALIQSSFRADP